jgi:hypothetical protein
MQQSVWVFQVDRNLDDESARNLQAQLEARLQDWKSHQDPVQSNVQVWDGRFIIVESFSDTSGCSKDFLRNEVVTTLTNQGLQLDEATVIAYRDADGEVQSISLNTLTDQLQNGLFDPETMIYDLTVVHQNTLDGWLKPLSESWLAKYIPATA